MDMLRVTARWSGFQGAPGYSNFFFAGGGGLISDAQQVADRVHAALTFLVSSLPSGVKLSVDREVAVINSASGELSDYRSITPKADLSGGATGNWSAASGGVVNWRTADVRFGRRIQGRTFIVPMGATAFDTTGTLSTAGLLALTRFAEELVGGDFDSEFGVWSRPRDGAGGVFATATAFSVPDMAAVLRSRRD